MDEIDWAFIAIPCCLALCFYSASKLLIQHIHELHDWRKCEVKLYMPSVISALHGFYYICQ